MAFLDLAAMTDTPRTFEAESTGFIARGPKILMRDAVTRDLSEGAKAGTGSRSLARMAACSSAA